MQAVVFYLLSTTNPPGFVETPNVSFEGKNVCVQTNYDYRQAVARMLVNLLTLDDKSLTNSKSESPQNVFQDDWAFLEELQNDAVVMESLENEKETGTGS